MSGSKEPLITFTESDFTFHPTRDVTRTGQPRRLIPLGDCVMTVQYAPPAFDTSLWNGRDVIVDGKAVGITANAVTWNGQATVDVVPIIRPGGKPMFGGEE